MSEQVRITTMDGQTQVLNLMQPWGAFVHEFLIRGGVVTNRDFIDRKWIAKLELLPEGVIEERPSATVLHLVPPEKPAS